MFPNTLVYAEYFRTTPVNSSRALQVKRAFELWYSQLSWYEGNIGSAKILKDAEDRKVAFDTMNRGDTFGAERTTLRLGSRGPNVSDWQRFLKLPETGYFDSRTQEATKLYQRGHGLDPDGVVGSLTWASMGSGKFKLPRLNFLSRWTVPLGGLLAGAFAAVVLSPKVEKRR